MNDTDALLVDPIDQFASLENSFPLCRRTRGASGAEWNKHVAQRAIERWRKYLTDACVRIQAERLDLPANEMVDTFQTSSDCFRLTRRA